VGSQVFCKPPVTGKAIPWHQDGQYWPIRPIATCSVWIALDDATPENGCMRYIPGSHKARKLEQHHRQQHGAEAAGPDIDSRRRWTTCCPGMISI
jgi:ectoine hydroxylase-related dioxygenase (phytanoyl-CoA dioxygenase family)